MTTFDLHSEGQRLLREVKEMTPESVAQSTVNLGIVSVGAIHIGELSEFGRKAFALYCEKHTLIASAEETKQALRSRRRVSREHSGVIDDLIYDLRSDSEFLAELLELEYRSRFPKYYRSERYEIQLGPNFELYALRRDRSRYIEAEPVSNSVH